MSKVSGLNIVEYKNENKRLVDEFTKDLPNENNELYELIKDVADYVYDKYDKNIVITMIYRTQEEQDEIYKDNERYKVKKFKSPHQFGHAVDLRSSVFTEEEIDDIVNYINIKYDDSNYYDWTAKNHEVSNHGMHFHIQFYKV